MKEFTDVFQLVACLPNLPEKEFKTGIGERVTDSLSVMDAVAPNIRAAYAERLARRARHHRKPVDRIAKRLGGLAGIPTTVNRNEQDVRDFYHHAYYAAFFVARFAMVSKGGYDCTAHSQIDGLVKTELAKRAGSLAPATATLAQCLSEWRTHRDIADYIMSGRRLEALANPTTLKQIAQSVADLFTVWGVP